MRNSQSVIIVFITLQNQSAPSQMTIRCVINTILPDTVRGGAGPFVRPKKSLAADS
jgi:hypothetical protein